MLRIDFKSSKPIYEQIISGIKELILRDLIKAEEKLPSVRELANTLAINPNTVSRAYFELEKEGIVEIKKGSGTYVKTFGRDISIKDRKNIVLDSIKNLIIEAKVLSYSEEDIILLVESTFRELGGMIDA